MKAKVNDRVKTLEVVEGIPKERNIPIGSIGVVIEAYESPEAEGYAVDFAFPDHSLVGDFAYADAYLEPDQFEVINECIEDTHQHATAQQNTPPKNQHPRQRHIYPHPIRTL